MSSTPLMTGDPVRNAGDALAGDAGPLLRGSRHLVDEVAQLTETGGALLRHGVQQAQDGVVHARDGTVAYIQREPLKAVLMAAAGGALLMWLGTLLARRGPH